MPSSDVDAVVTPNLQQVPFTDLLTVLQATPVGLTDAEATARLERYGRNELPEPPPLAWWQLAWRQLQNPITYVIGVAFLLAMIAGEHMEAGFIALVILLNVVVGVIQEFSAERSAQALRQLTEPHATVLRAGKIRDTLAALLVPGDVVVLESGNRVPADLRLLQADDLRVDESLLTGESMAVSKVAMEAGTADGGLGDQQQMLYSGTLLTAGRCRGVVIATGTHTVLGQLAASLGRGTSEKPPLVQRMERFAHQVSLLVGMAAVVVIALGLWQGQSFYEVVIFAIALGVSAIPEGLPVAITIALAVAVHRLSRRRVIVRRLVAVESLGSCTFIASDKTGTLTENQLAIRRIVLPDGRLDRPEHLLEDPAMQRLVLAGALVNEAIRTREDDTWVEHGDAVDLAGLRLAEQAGVTGESLPEIQERLPYESERAGAAVWVRDGATVRAYAKGAPEVILTACSDPEDVTASLRERVEELAAQGYKVLALSSGVVDSAPDRPEALPQGLQCAGLIALQDPIRPEVPEAIARCKTAGIDVAMITGDHPQTALTIGRELGLASSESEVVTGQTWRESDPATWPALVQRARIFARVDPAQKLQIVETLMRSGEAVAVTGDGANDAPALKAAHVGVAMGQRGTDIARESAELILTDDNFASLVNGVEEGRVAYNNIRKVVHLLVSTSVAEVLLVMTAMVVGSPVPLNAVQLLWLNLVTNGIQDVALAFESAEGDEAEHPPRPLQEPLFNRVMIERVILSGLVMGGVCWGLFTLLLQAGMALTDARNHTLLLLILFENVQVGVCRSELRSAFTMNPLRSPLLLWGTLTATLVHAGAMHWPVMQQVLSIHPVSGEMWLELLGLAMSVLLASELHKLVLRRRERRVAQAAV